MSSVLYIGCKEGYYCRSETECIVPLVSILNGESVLVYSKMLNCPVVSLHDGMVVYPAVYLTKVISRSYGTYLLS